MHPLVGYGDHWSVTSAERIRFMVGSFMVGGRNDTPFQRRFSRQIRADRNPDSPGYRREAAPEHIPEAAPFT